MFSVKVYASSEFFVGNRDILHYAWRGHGPRPTVPVTLREILQSLNTLSSCPMQREALLTKAVMLITQPVNE